MCSEATSQNKDRLLQQGQNAIPGALCPAEGGVGAACGADVLGQVPVSYKLYLLICKAAASEGGCEEPRMRVHAQSLTRLK